MACEYHVNGMWVAVGGMWQKVGGCGTCGGRRRRLEEDVGGMWGEGEEHKGNLV